MPNNQEDLNRKLNYLNETKQEIKRSLKAKGQPVNDNTTFREYANLVNNITTGTDTDDATATADDILNPKTAYIKGQKVVGNITTSYIQLDEAIPVNIVGDIDYWVVDLERNLAITGSGTIITIRRIKDNAIISEGEVSFNTLDLGSPYGFNIYNTKFSIDSDYETVGIWISFNKDSTNSAFMYFQLKVDNLEIIDEPIVKQFNLDLNTQNFSDYSTALKIFPRPTYRNQIGLMRRVSKGNYGIVVIECIDSDMNIIMTSSQAGGLWDGSQWGGSGLTAAWSADGRYIWGRGYGNNYIATNDFRCIYDCTQKKLITTNDSIVLLSDNFALDTQNIYSLPDMNIIKTGLSFSFLAGGVGGNQVTPAWSGYSGEYCAFARQGVINIIKFNSSNFDIVLESTKSIANITHCMAVPNKYLTWYESSILKGYQYSGEQQLVAMNYKNINFYYPYNTTAKSNQLLEDAYAYNVNGLFKGTMPNNGTLNITPGVENQSLPLGYIDGGIVKGDENLVPENIIEGKTIFGVQGNATGSQLRLVQRNIEYLEGSNIEINVYDSAHNRIDLLGNNSYLINTNLVYIQIEQNGYKYIEQEKSITVNSYIDAQISELTNTLTDDYENSNLNLTGTINNQSPSYSSSGTLTFNTVKDYKGLYTNGSSYITYSLNTSISSYDVQFDFYKANTASYSRVCLIQGPNYEIEIKGSSNTIYWDGELSGGWIQNQWNTLKLHKEGNRVQLYINNKLIATKTYSAAITGIRLGRGNDSGNYFTGYYKNVVITDNNKTPEQPIITITPIGDTIDIIPKDIEQQIAIPEGTIQANVSAIDITQTQYYEECLELSNQILGRVTSFDQLYNLIITSWPDATTLSKDRILNEVTSFNIGLESAIINNSSGGAWGSGFTIGIIIPKEDIIVKDSPIRFDSSDTGEDGSYTSWYSLDQALNDVYDDSIGVLKDRPDNYTLHGDDYEIEMGMGYYYPDVLKANTAYPVMLCGYKVVNYVRMYEV